MKRAIANVLVGAVWTCLMALEGIETANAEIEEIVVQARKRDETSLSVPVVMTAYSRKEIEQRAVDSTADLAAITPSFNVGDSLSQNGGVLYLRGIGTTGSNNSNDTSVALNIDGIPIAKANANRLGTFDLEQIEILKGPQALFFGKNSPAGIVSYRSADPTDEFFMQLRTGYEAEADETIGEVIISGPITERVGARLSMYYSDMKGDMEAQKAPPGSTFFVEDDRGPDRTEYFGRLTLTYEGDKLSLRSKIAYNSASVDSVFGAKTQRICDGALPGSGTLPLASTSSAIFLGRALLVECDDLDNEYVAGYPGGTAFDMSALDEDIPSDEAQFLDNEMLLASVQADYWFSDELSLTSITGLYKTHQELFGELNAFPGSMTPLTLAPGLVFPLNAFASISSDESFHQLSEELRLTSSFHGPLNFLAGIFYEDSRFHDRTAVYFPSPAPDPGAFANATPPWVTVDGRTLSAFGELRYDFSDHLELSGGVRWTREEKDLRARIVGVAFPLPDDSTEYSDLSPQMTLTWRPSVDLTVFGSYKTGFKSGGFATSSSNFTNPTVPFSQRGLPFNEENIKGFEVGVKALLFDGTLRLSANVYDFDLDDHQLSRFVANTAGGFFTLTENAASASLRGAELDWLWAPSSVSGMTISGSINYNKARYEDYVGPCPRGAVPRANGECTPGVGGPSGEEDKSGDRMMRSNDLGAAMGFNFDRTLAGGRYTLSFGADAVYTSEYDTLAEAPRFAEQDAYWLVDAHIGFGSADQRWKVSLIGRNLTDEYFNVLGFNDPLGSSDVFATKNRGKEVLLRLSVTPSAFGR